MNQSTGRHKIEGKKKTQESVRERSVFQARRMGGSVLGKLRNLFNQTVKLQKEKKKMRYKANEKRNVGRESEKKKEENYRLNANLKIG